MKYLSGNMKRINQKGQGVFTLYLSIMLLLSILGLHGPIDCTNSFMTYCSLTKTLTETREALEGFLRFIGSISAIFKEISNIAGFRVIALLATVLFFSAVLSFIGVPKGKTSFLLALIIVNALWLLWEKSYNSSSDYMTIVKTNGILLIPVVAFIALKRTLPLIYSRFISILYRRCNLFRRRLYEKKNIIEILKRYQDCSNEFEKSLIEDILSASDDRITFSQSTNKSLGELDEIIKTIKR